MADVTSIINDLERWMQKKASCMTEPLGKLEPGYESDAGEDKTGDENADIPPGSEEDKDDGGEPTQQNSPIEEDTTDPSDYMTEEKTAALANEILGFLNKAGAKKQPAKQGTKKQASLDTKEAALKETTSDMTKKAMYKQALEANYKQGVEIADIYMNELAKNMTKQAGMNKEAMYKQALEQNYKQGQILADLYMRKLAADISTISPILQQLAEKGMIDASAQESIKNSIGAAPKLNREAVDTAVQGLPNAQQIAEALYKIIEGQQEPTPPMEPPRSVSGEQAATEELADTENKVLLNDVENKVVEAALHIIRQKEAAMKNKKNKKKQC